MNEPILGKHPPRYDHYRTFTWDAFLKLREAAQLTADSAEYPVYLVGSALYKNLPRDIDVSMILPLEDYELVFGKLPERQEDYGIYLRDVFLHSLPIHTSHTF